MAAAKQPGAPTFKKITFSTIRRALALGLSDMSVAKG